MREAYNQVVAIQLRHMREAVEEINDDVRALTHGGEITPHVPLRCAWRGIQQQALKNQYF